MPHFVIKPWRDDFELLKVRSQFYPPTNAVNDERRHAVDMVGAWKLRGSLPHKVESTALLIDAILNDEKLGASAYSIRSTYSTAFCRFVTGLVDSEQNSTRKIPMWENAKKIGLPVSFVDLRHQATHEDLPPLLVLQQAARRSVQWLWDSYWKDLEYRIGALNIDDAFANGVSSLQEQFREILRPYLKSRLERIKMGKPMAKAAAELDSASDEACQKCVKICKDKEQTLMILAGVLLETRFLVPANRKLGASMDGIFVMWEDLLKRLTNHQHRFLRILVEEMTIKLVQPSQLDVQFDAYRQAVYMWVIRILKSEEWALRRRRYYRDQSGVISTCIMGPNFWSRDLARSLVEAGDEVLKEQWDELVGVPMKKHGSSRRSSSDGTISSEIARAREEADELNRVLANALNSEASSDESEDSADARVGVERNISYGRGTSLYQDEIDDQDESDISLSEYGWSKWKGPWASKPIGLL
ncbi:MAG: hypothetical protein M1819_000301 [Sarea resinae]|nr:MAG: hypothetical protein M1819_000301 [Sarea resinae]